MAHVRNDFHEPANSDIRPGIRPSFAEGSAKDCLPAMDLDLQGTGPSSRKQSSVNILVALNCAISPLCALNAVGDILKDTSSPRKNETIRFEGKGLDHHRAVMEQCLPLKDLVADDEESEWSGRQGNLKIAAVVDCLISSFSAIYADRQSVTIRVEVDGSHPHRAIMEQSLPLNVLLTVQEKLGSLWRKG